MAPEKHDQRNSVIAMVHFIGMAAESILSESDIEILKSSPASRNLLGLIDHLRNNSPDTYWESQICNSFTKGQRKRLRKGCAEYAAELDSGHFPFSDRLTEMKY